MSEGHARNLSYYANKILRDAKNCNPTLDEAQGIATNILLGETSKSNKRLKLIALEYWMQFIGRPIHFKKPRATNRNHVYITEEQMRTLIMSSKNYRDAVILELLCTTGMRVGELRELDFPDLDFVNGVIKIRHGKGDREREVFMTEECRRFLNAYIGRWEIDQGPLFLSRKGNRMSHNALWKVVKVTAFSAGLPSVSPHVLRHSYATCFAGKNDNVFILQELLGHSTIEMTKRYYHSNREVKRKGAMLGAPTMLTHG
jgi:integrase